MYKWYTQSSISYLVAIVLRSICHVTFFNNQYQFSRNQNILYKFLYRALINVSIIIETEWENDTADRNCEDNRLQWCSCSLLNTLMRILFIIYSLPFGFDTDGRIEIWKQEAIQLVGGLFRSDPVGDLMRMSPCGEYKRTGN